MDSREAHAPVRGTSACLALAAVLVLLTALASPAFSAPLPKLGYARVEPACGRPKPGEATCFALVRRPVPASEADAPGVHPFLRGNGAATSGPAGGLTPLELASAYGYDPEAEASSQTVGIVDAYDDPNIESDLSEFDSEYGLPECTEANKCFKKVGQSGETTSLPAPDKTGWSVEESLDVEAVHASCWTCKIVLVEAKNPEFTNLAEATNRAVALGATEVSNSYGGAEAEVPAAEAAYNHPGVVIAAATGDFGWDGWVYFKEERVPPRPPRPNIPASLPTVVSVGGTSLKLTGAGKRASETVWDGDGELAKSKFLEGATGGGCSTIYAAQPWQSSTPGYPAAGCKGNRLSADVSAVADPLTGFDIFDSYECGTECNKFRRGKSWLTIGGTSLSTPLVSAMYALAGGSNGVRYPALTLYGHLGTPSLFDVTQGGSGYCDKEGKACNVNAAVAELSAEFPQLVGVQLDCEGTTACNATTGFDGPSGVGAPASIDLFTPLKPTAAIVPPAKPLAGLSLPFASTGSSDPYPGGLSGANYEWDFGDGHESTGATTTHTFASGGTYTVTLTLTDAYGLKSAVASTEVTVVEPTQKELEEAEKKAKEEAEQKAKQEAEKKAREEAEKKTREEAEHRARAEEEARKKKSEEQAEKKAEEETLKEKAAEEAATLKAEEETAARIRSEEEAAKRHAEEEAIRNAGEVHVGSGEVAVFKAVSDPAATLAGSSLKASGGSFTVKIACPEAEASCEGTVTVQTAAATSAAKRRVVTLASGHFKVAGGKVVSVKLHLAARGRTLLAHRRSLRVRVRIAAHDATGATHTGSAIATLRGQSHP